MAEPAIQTRKAYPATQQPDDPEADNERTSGIRKRANGTGPTVPVAPFSNARPSLRRTIELGARLVSAAAEGNGNRQTPGDREANSYRRLARRLDLPLAASTVWRAVAIYNLSRKFPELLEYEHLGIGHLSVIVSLKGELQPSLMRQAEQQRWSRRHLERVARTARQARSGHPRSQTFGQAGRECRYRSPKN